MPTARSPALLLLLWGTTLLANLQSSPIWGQEPATSPAPAAPRILVMGADASLREVLFEGDQQLAVLMLKLSQQGGGTLKFFPGIYLFQQGINLPGLKGVHLEGTPGTIFRFRSLEEWGRVRTTAAHNAEEKVLTVDHPELIRPGARYQLFYPDQRGGRLLECTVASVEGERLSLGWASVTHPEGDSIPAGAYVLPEINFFDSFRGGDLSFRDIIFDGNCQVGQVLLEGRPFFGHTTHSGIIVRNLYRPPEPRPATRGIRILRCEFRNLLGRGVALYNLSGITVRDCRFVAIGTEGLEIDHWASEAVIAGNEFRECGTGIQLNDCNQVMVSDSSFTACNLGIRVLDALKDRSTNRGLVIRGNVFTENSTGLLLDPFAEENIITGNLFRRCGPVAVVLNGDRNIFTSNVVSGSTEVGVLLRGRSCILDDNVFLPPPDQPSGFTPVRRP